MKVLIDKISNIQKYEQDWNILFHNGKFTPFQSYDWIRMLIKEYDRNIIMKFSSKAYIAILVTDKIEILFPFYVKTKGRKRGIFLFGCGGKTDYLDFMYSAEMNHSKLKYLLKSICETFSVRKVVFQLLNSNSLSYRVLSTMDEVTREEKNECAVIRLPKDANVYYNSLSKSFKQNIRTAKNRLFKDGKQYLIKSFPSIEIDEVKLTKYREIFKQRSTEKNDRFNLFDTLFRRYDIYFDSVWKVSDCIISELTIDNQIASYLISYFDNQGGIYISRITYDSKYSRYSPGILLVENLINNIYKESNSIVSFIDLTNGSEAYKFSFHAEIHYSSYIELEDI